MYSSSDRLFVCINWDAHWPGKWCWRRGTLIPAALKFWVKIRGKAGRWAGGGSGLLIAVLDSTCNNLKSGSSQGRVQFWFLDIFQPHRCPETISSEGQGREEWRGSAPLMYVYMYLWMQIQYMPLRCQPQIREANDACRHPPENIDAIEGNCLLSDILAWLFILPLFLACLTGWRGIIYAGTTWVDWAMRLGVRWGWERQDEMEWDGPLAHELRVPR